MIAFPGYEFLNYQTQPKFMNEYNLNNNGGILGQSMSGNKFEDNNYFDQSSAKLLQSNSNSASFGGLRSKVNNNNNLY